MEFTQDASENKKSFKAGGYKQPKNVMKVKKTTVNQIFDVGCNKSVNVKNKLFIH